MIEPLSPTFMLPAIGLIVLVAIAVWSSLWGKFLAQEGPPAPEKSAAEMVAELAAKPSTGALIANLFVETQPEVKPQGPANCLVVYDENGQQLIKLSLASLKVP